MGKDREVDVSGGDVKSPALDAPVQSTFGFTHQHTGLSGDGKKIAVSSLDTTKPFVADEEARYTPVNATTSGREYKIQVIEVTDPETQQIQPVIQVILV